MNQLLEVSPYEVDQGNLIGRDPRKLTGQDFVEAEIELRVPTKAIRAKCYECVGGSESEIRKCTAVTCPLWAMRMGGLSRELRKIIKLKEAEEKEAD